MALNSALTVHLEKAPENLFSTYVAEMRIWLGAHKNTPVNFRLLGGPIEGLNVHFGSSEEAILFEREFGSKRSGASASLA
jgi:hypothetical protein